MCSSFNLDYFLAHASLTARSFCVRLPLAHWLGLSGCFCVHTFLGLLSWPPAVSSQFCVAKASPPAASEYSESSSPWQEGDKQQALPFTMCLKVCRSNLDVYMTKHNSQAQKDNTVNQVITQDHSCLKEGRPLIRSPLCIMQTRTES